MYNGVDHTIFKPGIKSKDPVILYVGRVKYYKSLNVFIHTAKRVLEIVPHAKFIIAGDGEEKHNLQKFTKKLGLENNITFTGYISEDEKIKLLQEAWVLVNPSYMEGWGITTIEANSCGTPVIASNVPGLRDSIKNSETGILVPYGDIDAFEKNILEIISNTKLRKSYEEKARNWAQNYSWDRSASEFYKKMKNTLSYKINKKFVHI